MGPTQYYGLLQMAVQGQLLFLCVRNGEKDFSLIQCVTNTNLEQKRPESQEGWEFGNKNGRAPSPLGQGPFLHPQLEISPLPWASEGRRRRTRDESDDKDTLANQISVVPSREAAESLSLSSLVRSIAGPARRCGGRRQHTAAPRKWMPASRCLLRGRARTSFNLDQHSKH